MNYSPRYGQFRGLLRKIREEARLNQSELAEKLGKPQTFVSKVELGERRIDFLETIDFCAACGVSPVQFLSRLQDAGVSDAQNSRAKRRSPRSMDREGRLKRRGE